MGNQSLLRQVLPKGFFPPGLALQLGRSGAGSQGEGDGLEKKKVLKTLDAEEKNKLMHSHNNPARGYH